MEAVMRALLTNDDGVNAEGLLAVREQLMMIFDSVVTVAPDEDSSGFARKCTYKRPVRVRRRESGRHPVYSCDGTPTDCVRVGILGGLGLDPDLVVSGINHGANLADDVTYSGTVGAGLEAVVLGVSALCLSQQTPTGSFSVNYEENLAARGLAYDFTLTAPHGAALAAAMVIASAHEPVVLSVNYPYKFERLVTQITTPGRRNYPRASTGVWPQDSNEQFIYLFGEPDEMIPDSGESEGTDIAALRAGHVSITPLSLGLGSRFEELPDSTRSYLQRFEANLLTNSVQTNDREHSG
jgi:5'-nucleotidase